MNLKAGERVQIDVDSIGIDPFITLWYASDEFDWFVHDDDGGGGLFGENSRILFEAPEDGSYILGVIDQYQEDVGSYFVRVTASAEAVLQTEPELKKETWRTPHGKLVHYESDRFSFGMAEQVDWVALPGEKCDRFVLCYFWGSSAFLVLENALHELRPQERSRGGFIESLDSSILHEPGSQKLSEERITTPSGLELDVLNYKLDNGRWLSTIVVYVDEIERGVFALLAFHSADTQFDFESMVEFSYESLRVRD